MRWRFLRDFWVDFASLRGVSSGEADKVVDVEVETMRWVTLMVVLMLRV
jgi:hypothetical protein